MAGKRVVWVLGAGFSRPLGGPLLPELFSPTSFGDIETRYPKHEFGELYDERAKQVRWLYRYGLGEAVDYHTGTEAGTIDGERLWTNAEDFIDYLDTATEDPGKDAKGAPLPRPHFDRLSRILRRFVWGPGVGYPFDDLRTAARRLIAAECCGFLIGADTRREKWSPFVRWERMLTANDTIISFNYDLVVESLRDARNIRASREAIEPTKVSVVHPTPVIDKGNLRMLPAFEAAWQRRLAKNHRVKRRRDDQAAGRRFCSHV